MKSKNIIHLSGIAVLSVALGSASHAAIITQTANHTTNETWNSATPWGGTAPVAGNDYETASGFFTSAGTLLGTGTNVTGRLRDAGTTFDGDSLTIVSGTEVLLKQNSGTSSANLIMDGGILRLSPNSSGSATVAGTIDVQSTSVIGLVRNDNLTMTISSSLTGSTDLLLRGGGNNTSGNLLLILNGNLSGYTGNMVIGDGGRQVTVRLAEDYFLPSMTITLEGSADIFDLSNNISIGGFSFGASSLGEGTYTVAELNDEFTTDRFTGDGTLTVIPEPSTAILSGLGLLALLRRRRTA